MKAAERDRLRVEVDRAQRTRLRMWQQGMPRPRCAAFKQIGGGDRCNRGALEGSLYCSIHGQMAEKGTLI